MQDLIRRHAARSDHSLHHHVAVIERHGRIIQVSVNMGWRHAEENAIRRTPPHLLRGATIHSYRVGTRGCLRNAKPCIKRGDDRPSCRELIELAGIKWLVYSNENGEMIRERMR
jgi:pyrimidine deaminase RibD-like protein